jgi:hypothetical protein
MSVPMSRLHGPLSRKAEPSQPAGTRAAREPTRVSASPYTPDHHLQSVVTTELRLVARTFSASEQNRNGGGRRDLVCR